MIGTPWDAPRTQSARHVQPHSSPRSSSLFRYTAELEAKQKEAEEPKLRSQKLKLKHRKLHTAYKAADDAASAAATPPAPEPPAQVVAEPPPPPPKAFEHSARKPVAVKA